MHECQHLKHSTEGLKHKTRIFWSTEMAEYHSNLLNLNSHISSTLQWLVKLVDARVFICVNLLLQIHKH